MSSHPEPPTFRLEIVRRHLAGVLAIPLAAKKFLQFEKGNMDKSSLKLFLKANDGNDVEEAIVNISADIGTLFRVEVSGELDRFRRWEGGHDSLRRMQYYSSRGGILGLLPTFFVAVLVSAVYLSITTECYCPDADDKSLFTKLLDDIYSCWLHCFASVNVEEGFMPRLQTRTATSKDSDWLTYIKKCREYFEGIVHFIPDKVFLRTSESVANAAERELITCRFSDEKESDTVKLFAHLDGMKNVARRILHSEFYPLMEQVATNIKGANSDAEPLLGDIEVMMKEQSAELQESNVRCMVRGLVAVLRGMVIMRAAESMNIPPQYHLSFRSGWYNLEETYSLTADRLANVSIAHLLRSSILTELYTGSNSK